MNTLKGSIYYADLDPVIGSEQGGIRPVVILQNSIQNYYSETTVVAPITTKVKTGGFHVFLKADKTLKNDSVILLEQIRTIDKSRLLTYIGKLSQEHYRKVNNALKKMFYLDWEVHNVK